MRGIVSEFIRRGLIACGFGPVVLAACYYILNIQGLIETLTVEQVCTGIFSLTALAFIAGGMNVLYHIERLPLMIAILIHGSVLYIAYLGTYLLNDWLEWGGTPVLVFSVIFIVSYMIIWAVIFCITKKRTDELNKILMKKHETEGEY